MRKVVLGVGISIDGYIARKNGAVDFLFIPKDYPMGEFTKSVDTAVMGRKTFEVSLKLGGGSFDHGMKSYVFSRSKPAGERHGVIFTRKTPARLMAGIRKQPGKDIWLMGGRNGTRLLEGGSSGRTLYWRGSRVIGFGDTTISPRLSAARFHAARE